MPRSWEFHNSVERTALSRSYQRREDSSAPVDSEKTMAQRTSPPTMAQWSPVFDGCPIVTGYPPDCYPVSSEVYLRVTKENRYYSSNTIYHFLHKDNQPINILQPLTEPMLGVPATEGVLTEVGVRSCRLGVPFAGVFGERLSSWWTGVLGERLSS